MKNIARLVKELRSETGASFLDCKQALLAHNGAYEQAVAFLRQKNLNKAAKKGERQTEEGLIIVRQNSDTACLVTLKCETDFVALTSDFKALAHQLADLVLDDPALADESRVTTAVFPDAPDQTVGEAIQALIGKLGENIVLGPIARYPATDATIVHGYVHAGAISGYSADEGRLGVLVELAGADKTAVSAATWDAIARDLALHIASAAPEYLSLESIPAEMLTRKQEELWAEVQSEKKPEQIKEKIVTGRLQKYYKQKCLLRQPFVKDDATTVADWLEARSREAGTALSIVRFTRIAITT